MARVAQPAPTILVAAPDTATLDAIDEVLSELGYDVILATDTASAHDVIHRKCPSVLLIDLQLPGGGAPAIAAGLPDHRPPPLILLTNALAIDAARWAEDLGAVACLNRPLVLDQVTRTVVDAIRRAEADAGRPLPPSGVAC
jgi:DNA-binding NtrC family response regulator